MNEPVVLRPFAEEIWEAEHQLHTLGMVFPTRMTVVRLSGGRLFIHSPLPLTDGLKAQLNALGRVSCVIAPNTFHHLFAADYAAYGDARLFIAPGLEKKRPDLPCRALLDDTPPPEWAGQIDQVLLAGTVLLHEVVFFHRASRTLILTDLAANLRRTGSLPARLYFRLTGTYGRLGQNRLIRWLVRDRAAARRSVERMLQWDTRRVLMAHGEPITGEGGQALKSAFGWLLK